MIRQSVPGDTKGCPRCKVVETEDFIQEVFEVQAGTLPIGLVFSSMNLDLSSDNFPERSAAEDPADTVSGLILLRVGNDARKVASHKSGNLNPISSTARFSSSISSRNSGFPLRSR